MAGLHVRIVRGDKMIVNGAALHFLSDADLRIANKVRFIFGRQLMSPAEAVTTARRIYFAVQNAYVGEPHERAGARLEAGALIGVFRQATSSATARNLLDQMVALLEVDECYHALKIASRIVRHEDAVLAFAASKTKSAPAVYEAFT